MPNRFKFRQISNATLAVLVVLLTAVSSLLWRERIENVRRARKTEVQMTSWRTLETCWTGLCADLDGVTPERATQVLGKPSAAFPYVLGNDLYWDAPGGLNFKTNDKVEVGITWTTTYGGYGTNIVTRNKTECYYRYRTPAKRKQQEKTQ